MNSWTSSLSFVHPSYWCAGVKLQQAPIVKQSPSLGFERERGERDQCEEGDEGNKREIAGRRERREEGRGKKEEERRRRWWR